MGGPGPTRGAGWGGALAPTPELLAQVDALGPATADPHIDVEVESRPSPDFKFMRFVRRYRTWLLVGIVLVSLDAICTLAYPLLVKYGIDNGVAHVPQNPSAIWAASIVLFIVTLIDWYLMWAEARVMGRISERMLHALRVKIFAHLQRLGVDYYEHEMAGRIMTRMTTDIDALSALLQNGLVNALVNLVTFLGVGVLLLYLNPKLALITASILPPLIDRDDLVPLGVVARVQRCARSDRRGQRQPPGGPVGRSRLTGVRARRPQSGSVHRDRVGLPRCTRARATPRRRLLPVRRLPLRPRDRASCSAPAACSSRTTR